MQHIAVIVLVSKGQAAPVLHSASVFRLRLRRALCLTIVLTGLTTRVAVTALRASQLADICHIYSLGTSENLISVLKSALMARLTCIENGDQQGPAIQRPSFLFFQA